MHDWSALPFAPEVEHDKKWPQNHPSYFPFFDACRSEKTALYDCVARYPNSRRCDVTRDVFHISEFTSGWSDKKFNTLQLQNYLEDGPSQCPSFRLFFVCDDNCCDSSGLSSAMRLFLAHFQTPPSFILRRRMDESVPPCQVATEVRTNGPDGVSVAPIRILYILIQLSLSMRPADILAYPEYYSDGWVASMREWTTNNKLWGCHTILYLRYDLDTREFTILIANNTSAFHHMRQFCASPSAEIGRDDPFVFVVAYMEQLLVRSQNVEDLLQTWLLEWMETFGATSPGTDNTELFKHINYTSALLPRRVMYMTTISRTIERIKQEHKRFVDSHSTTAARNVASMVEERLDAQLQLASELRDSFSSLSMSFQRLSDTLLGYAQFRNGIITNKIASDGQKQAAATEALARDSKRDSEIMKRDSTTMKTITVVTLVYLPATFVSTLLSMGLFDFGTGSGGDGRVHIAREGWIFLAISLPLTALTLGLAYFWKRLKERQWKREDKDAETAAMLPARSR